ncbi:MAG: two-component regulator propeller domain-containing protein [Flavobacteriaceae bacterium]
MTKKIAFLNILLIPFILLSQDYSNSWKEYFSYNSINDVVLGNNKLYGSSENAVFSYDLTTHEINELTTINGLSGETITTLHYSETYGLLMIGHDNGLIEIAFDSNNEVLSVVDIVDKPTIPPNDKSINHFNEYNGLVYISTGYGVSVYDLEHLEFGDTYYLGTSGTQINVSQTTIFQDYIYVACQDGNGIKRALLSNPNLIDSQEWEQVTTGDFYAIQEFAGKLYAYRTSRHVFEVSINNTLTQLLQYADPPLDVKVFDGVLSVTTKNDNFTYLPDYVLITQVNVNSTASTQFTSGVANQTSTFIGTVDLGVLATQLANPIEFEEIHPDGPLRNSPFSIQAGSNELWVTFGDYTLTYNPSPLRKWGISHLVEEDWINISQDSVLGARDLNAISINPFNTSQVFISSFNDGILEVNDNVPEVLYNEDNSGLESLVIANNPNLKSIRVSGTTFDNEGLLWSCTGRVEHPLKSYNPSTGQWQEYGFDDLIINPLTDEFGYSDIVIDQNGNKWMGGYKLGLVGVNAAGTIYKNVVSDEQNLPSSFISALAVDKRNQLWIGTIQGLRVLYNTSGFFEEENPEVSSIIIEEDGLGSELLFQQFVSSIAVDGSNNKWIGTFDTGLFYFTANGQETIYHFTKDNSPLPSNNILDLSLDSSTGVIYIATDKGLLSFFVGGSDTKDSLSNAFVYPNPVRPTFNITEEKVKIKDISDNVNIKITDIEGNLVAEAQSRTNLRYKGYNLEIDGGTAYWNGKNLANNVVASGVYLIMLTDLDNLETKILKVMVVR